MKSEHLLTIASDQILLLAQKALYWPRQKTLMVADTHFGKAAAYRALGQPVPQGTTSSNLQRLDSLLETYPTERLIFLGDFLHALKSHAPATLAAIRSWRGRHADLHCILIRGNHDKNAGDPPLDWNFEVVNEPYLTGNFSLQHVPTLHATHHVIAGHTHPTFRLHGKGKQSLVLPCFYHEPALTLLPSFGDFTGGFQLEEQVNSRLFVTDGSCIWPINPS